MYICIYKQFLDLMAFFHQSGNLISMPLTSCAPNLPVVVLKNNVISYETIYTYEHSRMYTAQFEMSLHCTLFFVVFIILASKLIPAPFN